MKKKERNIKKTFRENEYPLIIIVILIILLLIIQFVPSIGVQNIIIIDQVIIVLGSISGTIIIVRGIQRKYTWEVLMKKFRLKKKPKVFEYVFFVGIFISTIILSIAYGESNRTTIQGFINFLQIYGIFLVFYGISIAFGYFHYIERLDD
jgi:hypothetical protein